MIPKQITPELRLALQSIDRALAGRAPLPQLLAEAEDAIRDAVPDHLTFVRHYSKADLKSRRAKYQISIKGSRIDGAWNFTPGELAEILREVSILEPAERKADTELNIV